MTHDGKVIIQCVYKTKEDGAGAVCLLVHICSGLFSYSSVAYIILVKYILNKIKNRQFSKSLEVDDSRVAKICSKIKFQFYFLSCTVPITLSLTIILLHSLHWEIRFSTNGFTTHQRLLTVEPDNQGEPSTVVYYR